MSKSYKVLLEWFRRTDKLGYKISTWCKEVNEKEVYCFICQKNIFCGSKGFPALTQHVMTTVHKNNASLKLHAHQLKLCSLNPDDREEKKSNQLQVNNHKDNVAKAEIIWALKSVKCNMAASDGDDLKDIFKEMFPSSDISEGFCLGRTKLSYLITEALGPFFRSELLQDARRSHFSLLFDETTNNADKKELQFQIRFWSEKKNEIVCRHLQTVFLGHATAKDLVGQIENVLNDAGLAKSKLLMLGSDGPNVNKKVWQIMNNSLIEERGIGLLDVGSCNLHIVHNAFQKGLEEYGDSACELITSIYYYFKKFPARWEDYEAIQFKTKVPFHRFLKHVSNRWLTVGPAAQRVMEQWPAIEEYFLKYIPQHNKQLMQTIKFSQIVKIVKYVDINAELSFLIDSCSIYMPFLNLFQRSEPLIHALSNELKAVLQKIIGRICKANSIKVGQSMTSEHLIRATDVDCGESTTRLIKKLHEKDQPNVFGKIQRHYMASYNYVVKKNVVGKDNMLTHFQYFHSGKIKDKKSLFHISELAKKLSFIGIKNIDLKDEWRLLQTENIKEVKSARIDHFWRELFLLKSDIGNFKYPCITRLVKACLSLSHGNSDVERGFSVSRRILANDKSAMSERVLNDRLCIRDALQNFDSVCKVPITKELISLAHGARRSYAGYLEAQKRLKEQELKEREEEEMKLKEENLQQENLKTKTANVKKLEEKAKSVFQEKKETQETADALFLETNERIKAAIQKKDLEGVRIAQAMMEGILKLREKEREHEQKEEKLNNLVQKRKTNLIDSFFTKKAKKD